MKLNVDSTYCFQSEGRVCQGDIYKDVKSKLWVEVKETEINELEILFPYIVILTQDCDLEQDIKNRGEKTSTHDKYLQSILVSPGYIAEELKTGMHLQDLHLSMEKFDHDRWNLIKKNHNQRYYFLDSDSKYGVPELVIDFKHYYTIPRDFFYRNYRSNYVATMDQLFRENLSQKFSQYLSRIGLPNISSSPVIP